MTSLRHVLNSWPGRVGAVLVSVIVVFVLVSFVWVPYDPLHVEPGDRWLGMSRDHWFGTDGAGKDIFSQVLVGARVSLFVAIASALIAGVVGIVLGVVSTVTPRIVGESVAHLIDVLIAIPTLVLALVLVGVFQGSLITVSLAIGVGSGVVLARILRGELSRVLTQDYVIGRPRLGDLDVAHDPHPSAAQRRPDRHRPALARGSAGDPRRGGAVVPRPDVACPAVVGAHARRAADDGHDPPRRRRLPRGDARPRHARLQPPR